MNNQDHLILVVDDNTITCEVIESELFGHVKGAFTGADQNRKGFFRQDLFYRLNVISMNIPPLHKRGDDIILLANHFALIFSRELEKEQPEFSDNVTGNHGVGFETCQ